MLCASSNTVRHDAIPRDGVHAAAMEWASQLVRAHSEIVRIGYLGSYARGDYVPGSDLDVLIEVHDAPASRMEDRAMRYRPESFPVAVQIVVFTKEELVRLRCEGNAFVDAIFSELRGLLDRAPNASAVPADDRDSSAG